jgi:hypothetical protein
MTLQMKARVDIDLDDVINHDVEWFLDHLSERITGTLLLQDIAWDVKGTTKTGILILLVTGWVGTADLEKDEITAIQEHRY